jgi:hypothetical protein
MSDKRQPITLARVWVRSNIITTVLIVFILVSFVIHAITLGALFRIRDSTSAQLEISADQLARVRQQRVRYDFPIDQTFRLDTTVTISETVSVPLNINVPIRETIALPVETPLGTYTFDVPLDFSVPVSDTIEVPIQRDIPFQADIPINTELPVDINLSDPPLGDILKQFEDALRELRSIL